MRWRIAILVSTAIAEWFPVRERSLAMGIMNVGTAIGAVVAAPLILILPNVHWFGIASWRWVFFITGGFGLLWTVWWVCDYHRPEHHPRLSADERRALGAVLESAPDHGAGPVPRHLPNRVGQTP